MHRMDARNPHVFPVPGKMKYQISVRAAKQMVLSQASPGSTIRVPCLKALNRTLRSAVRAADDVPPFDNSAMDGFAVRVADCASVPVALDMREVITAGQWPSQSLQQGQCAAIMTGAPVPYGTDAIVPVEWTRSAGQGQVWIDRVPSPGAYIRRAGQDVKKGECVAEPGVEITSSVLGMIAAAGTYEVTVSRRPRVAVVTTGDELHAVPGLLPDGKIRDINGPVLSALLTESGACPLGPFHARDDFSSLTQVIEAALHGSDVLLVAGGVSVGQHDLVKRVLEEIGLVMLFWRVRQRPGGPLAFGLLGERAVFGLPGNPVSSAVCFEQYVRPYVAALLGRKRVRRTRMHAILETPAPKKKGMHFFVRGVVRSTADGRLMARVTGPQASNLFTSLVRANCIIHLDEAMGSAPAGTVVELEPFTWPAG